MENLKKFTVLVMSIVGLAAAVAWVNDLVNKPADMSFFERFAIFVFGLTVAFIVMSTLENRKAGKR